ncbi:hypothetical protein MASR1M8_27500 [Thermomonas brevis]
MALNRDLKELLSLLTRHDVDFLLVGAHAVAFHGFSRYTGDIDFWVRRSSENAERIMAALNEFGFGDAGLQSSDFMRENAVIQLGREPNRVDFLTFLTALDYDQCQQRKVTAHFEGMPVDIIGLEDLLKNKRETARPKDLADVDEFERSTKYRKE